MQQYHSQIVVRIEIDLIMALSMLVPLTMMMMMISFAIVLCTSHLRVPQLQQHTLLPGRQRRLQQRSAAGSR